MKSFQSPRVQFPSENSDFTAVNPGRYPPWLYWIFQKAFLWKPVGGKSDYSIGCEPEDLFRNLIQNSDSIAQAQFIEEHKSRCGKDFQTGSTFGLVNGLRMMTMELDFLHHSLIHRVVFKLPGGIRLKGLLALKGDSKKRPFVVVRLGIFSNVEEFLPERYLLMNLFEQGFANVLILENSTSADYIAYNQSHSVGGYVEGIQNMQVARILRSPVEPLSQLVSSLHFIGVSLGGHGVLFASLLNDFNSRKGKPLVQSFTGVCPVINLRENLDWLSQPGIRGNIVDYWASLRLDGLPGKYPVVVPYKWTDLLNFKKVFLPKVMGLVADQFRAKPPPLGDIVLPPPLEKVQDFWQANNFWSYYRNIRSPLLVLGTRHDDFVNPDINFRWLQKNAGQWNSQIGTVLFEEGYHCSLPIAYDWPTISAIFNGRIMSFDSSVGRKNREISVDITDQLRPELLMDFNKNNFRVGWGGQDRDILIKYTIRNQQAFTVSIPITELDFKFRQALGDPERLTIERWLHQNLQTSLSQSNSKITAHISWPQ